MSPAWLAVACWVLFWSLAGFVAMGLDKSRARNHEWRVSERTLYKIAVAGGAFGIVAGSSAFHHKTLKGSFTAVAYASAVAWLLLLFGLQRVLGSPFV